MKNADLTYLKLRYDIRPTSDSTYSVMLSTKTILPEEFMNKHRKLVMSWHGNTTIILNRIYHDRKGRIRLERDTDKVVRRFLKYLIQYEREQANS